METNASSIFRSARGLFEEQTLVRQFWQRLRQGGNYLPRIAQLLYQMLETEGVRRRLTSMAVIEKHQDLPRTLARSPGDGIHPFVQFAIPKIEVVPVLVGEIPIGGLTRVEANINAVGGLNEPRRVKIGKGRHVDGDQVNARLAQALGNVGSCP